MLTLRKSTDRGHAHHGWLESWHSFSFGDYVDVANIRFGALRVINEDIVQPGAGFDTHGHRDMEILTYILSGTLRHHDSMGNSGDLKAGDIQLMRAGTGVMHSEFSPGPGPVHLLQIWILPDTQGLAPSYWQKEFPPDARHGRWCVLVSPNTAEDALHIHQDARVSAARLDPAHRLEYLLAPGRRAYLHVARGKVVANGRPLGPGDALTYIEETRVELSNGEDAEVLLFDLT